MTVSPPGAGSSSPGSAHFVVTRTVHDRDWFAQQYLIAEELARALTEQAAARGLIVDQVSALHVESGTDGSWARLTREATAHPQVR